MKRRDGARPRPIILDPLRVVEERIRPDLRRAVGFGVVALAALVVGHEFNSDHPHLDGYRIASFACAFGVLVFGVAATRSAANELTRLAQRRAGAAATTPLRLLVLVIGYLLTVLALLAVLNVDLSQFLVGGAVTGVVIGIAAQQTLGNFFAGLVLLLARPYVAGDYVTIFSGAINGPHEGTVDYVGLLYTTVRTTGGPLHVPNSALLASAVRPSAPPDTAALPGDPTPGSLPSDPPPPYARPEQGAGPDDTAPAT